MIEEKLQKLLTEVNKVCLIAEQERKAKQSRGECYNVFNVLGLWSEEVRLHSAFIAELLNPKGSHGLGGSFLKAFLRIVTVNESFINVELVNQNIKERKIGEINETATEGGRIDIIIEDGFHALIIENKIYANEQQNQLLRYFNYAKREFRNGFNLIYLTLNGEEATNIPENEKVDYECMSYKEDIIEWLTECAKIAFGHPLVRETINQYIQLIKQLTNMTMQEEHINQVVEIAIQNIESTAAILESQYAINKVLREQYIFEPLEEYASKKELNIEITDYIKFSRPEWENYICVTKDGGNWTKMFIGITSDYQEGKYSKLDCLSNTNKNWPNGWEWINFHDWESAGSYKAIMSGEVANWIKNKIDEILQELEAKNITL